MKISRPPLFSSLLLAASLAAGCGDDPPGFRTFPDTGFTLDGVAERVVVLVYDGARLEETFGDKDTWGQGYSDAYQGPTAELLPSVRETLFPQGALVKPGYNVGATVTVPGHCNLLVGRRATLGHFSYTDDYTSFRYDYPTLFEALGRYGGIPAEQLYFLSNSNILFGTDYGIMPGFGAEQGGTFEMIRSQDSTTMAPDEQVVDRVKELLSDGAILVTANLKTIDDTGHANPASYADAVKLVDDPTVRLWEWIQSQSELADRTALVIVADHGRHRYLEKDYPWREHGDHCMGCREIPMFLMGPGIQQGIELRRPYTLEDVTQTIAWLLGVSFPYGNGMVMTDLLQEPPEITARAGATRVHASNGMLAWQEWSNDIEHRSQVLVDGEIVGSSTAFAVEEPRIASKGEHSYLCRRSMSFPTGDATEAPWIGECFHKRGEGAWEEIGFPTDRVQPFFAPSMAVDQDGALWITEMQNDTATNEFKTWVELRRWSEQDLWTSAEKSEEEGFFLTPTSLVLRDGTAWVAFPDALDVVQARSDRSIRVSSAEWPAGDTQTWSTVFISTPNASDGTQWKRNEFPVIFDSGELLELAWVGYSPTGAEILSTREESAGGKWTTPERLDGSGRVFSNVTPRYSPEGALFWASLDEVGEIELCRRYEASKTCVPVEHAFIDSVAPMSAEQVHASVSDGEGAWEIVELSFAGR